MSKIMKANIVEKVKDRKVHTIEGNFGNTCKKLVYNLEDARILGYGVVVLLKL